MDTAVVLLRGNDRLGVAIEHRLVAAGCQVIKLCRANDNSIELSESNLRSSSVLLLAADDDADNVDLALTVRRLRSDLPVVIRLFDEALATYLRETLDRVSILSMSALAAPVYAEATLHAIANRRADRTDTSSFPAKARGRSRGRVRLDRVMLGAAIGFVAILFSFSWFFADALRLSGIDALYFVWTTVTTVGYGDIALRNESTAVKIVGMVLMFAGAASIAAFLDCSRIGSSPTAWKCCGAAYE